MKRGSRGTFIARLRARCLEPQPQAFAGQELPRAVPEKSGSLHGIGVDILRESRIEKIWARHGRRFAEKILADAELDAFARARHPVRFLAKAFAAKEACAKALGSGFAGVAYRDVGTLREGSGKPVLIFSARLRARLHRLGIQGGHVSLSDEGGMVCAMVVLERN